VEGGEGTNAGILIHFTSATLIQGFDARLDNRPFLVFDFRALWRSGLNAGVPEGQN